MSPGLAPVAVASTEQKASELLEQMLSRSPGRDNLVEDRPVHTGGRLRTDTDAALDSVHLVTTVDEDGTPTVRAVFASVGGATGAADELRRLGAPSVHVTEMVMDGPRSP